MLSYVLDIWNALSEVLNCLRKVVAVVDSAEIGLPYPNIRMKCKTLRLVVMLQHDQMAVAVTEMLPE